MNKCESCNCEHDESYGSGRFCSSKCARSFSTSKDDEKGKKVGKCIKCGVEVQVNKRTSESKIKCLTCFPKKKRKVKIKKVLCCIICGKEFENLEERSTCSKVCTNYLISLKACKRVQERGTNNFHTKRENFSYKIVENMEVDSKLEQAALIYLIDIFKADKIERFRSILNFWRGDYHKTFNPDFYVKKDEEVYIVEVKMKCSINSTHEYHTSIPFKKEALQAFCNEKKYKMIWLDFDYDKQLQLIYEKLLKSK